MLIGCERRVIGGASANELPEDRDEDCVVVGHQPLVEGDQQVGRKGIRLADQGGQPGVGQEFQVGTQPEFKFRAVDWGGLNLLTGGIVDIKYRWSPELGTGMSFSTNRSKNATLSTVHPPQPLCVKNVVFANEITPISTQLGKLLFAKA